MFLLYNYNHPIIFAVKFLCFSFLSNLSSQDTFMDAKITREPFLEILGMFRGRILKLYILSAEFGLTQSTPDTYISCGV